MTQHYSAPKRADDPHALPDIETFYGSPMQDDTSNAWWWWSCMPGRLPDGEPFGPFATEAEALADARESSGLCKHGAPDDQVCEECPAPELWTLQDSAGSALVFSMAPTIDYRPCVSAWTSKEHAQAQADRLGLDDLRPVRLSDSDARKWGRS